MRKDGTRVVLVPADYMIWDKRVAEAVDSVNSGAKGSSLELWILGSLSKQATAELQKLGWNIHNGAGPKLFADQK